MDPGDPLRMALALPRECLRSTDGGEAGAFASAGADRDDRPLTYHPSGSGEVWVTGSCEWQKAAAGATGLVV